MSRDGRGAFEWGLASVAVGGVAAVAAVPALTTGYSFVGSAYALEAVGAYAAVVALLPAAGFGLASLAAVGFGVRSAASAARSRRPAALGVAGILLGILAALLWAGVAVVWRDASVDHERGVLSGPGLNGMLGGSAEPDGVVRTHQAAPQETT